MALPQARHPRDALFNCRRAGRAVVQSASPCVIARGQRIPAFAGMKTPGGGVPLSQCHSVSPQFFTWRRSGRNVFAECVWRVFQWTSQTAAHDGVRALDELSVASFPNAAGRSDRTRAALVGDKHRDTATTSALPRRILGCAGWSERHRAEGAQVSVEFRTKPRFLPAPHRHRQPTP